MKILIGIIFAGMLTVGCEIRELPQEQPQSTQTTVGRGIGVITVDGCQYIKVTEGWGHTTSVSVIHKANCPNHQTTQ